MQKLKDIAKVVALACVPVVAAFACLLLFQVSDAVKRADAVTAQMVNAAWQAQMTLANVESVLSTQSGKLTETLQHVDRAIDATAATVKAAGETSGKLNDAIALTSHRINDLCPDPKAVDAAIHPCGTLADGDRTLGGVRDTSVQVAVSVKAFHQHEAELFTQESEAYAAMSKSVADFDALVADRNLRTIILNAATVTANAASATTDGKDWLHGKLYPTKKKGFISGFEATGDVAKHWMPSLF